MLKHNNTICSCGDCSAAMSRAYSIAEKMYADNECPNFQVVVAQYFYTIAAAGIRDAMLRQEVLPRNVPGFILEMATMDSMEVIGEIAKPLAVELASEILGKVDKWAAAMYDRLEKDFEATKKDEPNIGKPKG